MFGCRKCRIEISRCPAGHFHISIQPVTYLGKERVPAVHATLQAPLYKLGEKNGCGSEFSHRMVRGVRWDVG